MSTNTLRALTATHAAAWPPARVWPNGLGFDRRGWSYKFDERTEEWQAAREGYIVGSGPTPAAARLYARRDTSWRATTERRAA